MSLRTRATVVVLLAGLFVSVAALAHAAAPRGQAPVHAHRIDPPPELPGREVDTGHDTGQ